jgi:large subunit ribosomal protein L17
MRHSKSTFKLGRTASHRKAMVANMVKSLIENGRIVTTVVKAKEVRRHAERMVTLAKENSLASRRAAVAALQVRFNALTSKEVRRAKGGDEGAYNRDRKVIGQLFDQLGPRFAQRNGGYTRIVRHSNRVGDNAETCVLEYLGG